MEILSSTKYYLLFGLNVNKIFILHLIKNAIYIENNYILFSIFLHIEN